MMTAVCPEPERVGGSTVAPQSHAGGSGLGGGESQRKAGQRRGRPIVGRCTSAADARWTAVSRYGTLFAGPIPDPQAATRLSWHMGWLSRGCSTARVYKILRNPHCLHRFCPLFGHGERKFFSN